MRTVVNGAVQNILFEFMTTDDSMYLAKSQVKKYKKNRYLFKGTC